MKIKYFLLGLALLFCLATLPFVFAYNQTNFTASSTYNVSTGTNRLFIQAWGGGGGGAGRLASGTGGGGGGGGGGAYADSFLTVTPGEIWTVTVGAAGAAGAAGENRGGDGGNSTFNRTTQNVTAEGGIGGNTAGTAASRGGSTENSYGTIKYAGGYGSSGTIGVGNSGAGGGGAGTTQAGFNAVAATAGAGGSLYGGTGATGRTTDGAGSAGSIIGGGGSGGYCDGSCATVGGGAGARGEVRVTALNSSDTTVRFIVKDVVTLNNVVLGTNVTLQNPSSLLTYNFSLTNGNWLDFNGIIPGSYRVIVSSQGYPLTYAALTVTQGSDQEATFYVDASSQSFTFSASDTLGQIVSNASISFSRNINGSILVYTQGFTDFSSFLTVNLNPNVLYTITGSVSGDTYNNFTGLIDPDPSVSTYPIQFTFLNSGINYSNPFNDTFVSNNAYYLNTTKFINVTWEVISGQGDLTYWGLRTSYNHTNYTVNSSGSPGGGITFINISDVNLSVQDSVNVTFWFKRTGYEEVNLQQTFTFLDFNPENTTITTGLLDPPTAPSSPQGRAILGIIIIVVIMTAAGALTGTFEVSVIAGLLTMAFLSSPNVALFPYLFGTISVVVGSIVLIAAMVGKR